jgi:hypothetical protein
MALVSSNESGSRDIVIPEKYILRNSKKVIGLI